MKRFQSGDDSLCDEMDKYLAPRTDRAATVHAIVRMLHDKGSSATYKRVRDLADKLPARYVRVGQTIVLALPVTTAGLETARSATPPAPEPAAAPAAEPEAPAAPPAYPCELCSESFPTEKDWIRHINTNAHKVKQAARNIEAAALGTLSSGPLTPVTPPEAPK